MNVYDFDKTIFNGDSTFHFYLFCLKKHKKIAKRLPSLLSAWFKFYVLHKGTKTQFKEKMYSFLNDIDTEKEVEEFWKAEEKNIKTWYLLQKENTDIIISASPEFLLSPICKKMSVNLIASNVSKKDGKTIGENCYNEEKVKRLYTEYPEAIIDKFYSDGYSDTPLAEISKEAFIVKKDKILKWDFSKKGKIRV